VQCELSFRPPTSPGGESIRGALSSGSAGQEGTAGCGSPEQEHQAEEEPQATFLAKEAHIQLQLLIAGRLAVTVERRRLYLVDGGQTQNPLVLIRVDGA